LGTATTNITTLFSNAGAQASSITSLNNAVINLSTNVNAITTGTGFATTTATNLANVSIDSINSNITAANAAIQTLSANIGNLVAGAPGALDTLIEINSALSNNANFSSVMVTWLGNITTNVTAANTNINSINANLGAYQTYANTNINTILPNLGTATSNINSINANLGAYQTYANSALTSLQGTVVGLVGAAANSYGDSNVAAYLVTATGNIAAGNVSVGNLNITGFTTLANVVKLANLSQAQVETLPVSSGQLVYNYTYGNIQAYSAYLGRWGNLVIT
jgi:flagellin-like hook-associated protein FlgL